MKRLEGYLSYRDQPGFLRVYRNKVEIGRRGIGERAVRLKDEDGRLLRGNGTRSGAVREVLRHATCTQHHVLLCFFADCYSRPYCC